MLAQFQVVCEHQHVVYSVTGKTSCNNLDQSAKVIDFAINFPSPSGSCGLLMAMDPRARRLRLLCCACLATSWHVAFQLPAGTTAAPRQLRSVAMKASWLEMLDEAVGTPTPQPASPIIPESVKPLDADLMTRDLTAFELEEKGLAMSGEDFEVKTPEGELILRIGGGNRVPIPGMPVWDKLTVSAADGRQIATLERQAFAMTATYDVLRANGKKFGRITKAMFALTSTFELYQEDDTEGGALLRAEGSFSDKSYVMKSRQGEAFLMKRI